MGGFMAGLFKKETSDRTGGMLGGQGGGAKGGAVDGSTQQYVGGDASNIGTADINAPSGLKDANAKNNFSKIASGFGTTAKNFRSIAPGGGNQGSVTGYQLPQVGAGMENTGSQGFTNLLDYLKQQRGG